MTKKIIYKNIINKTCRSHTWAMAKLIVFSLQPFTAAISKTDAEHSLKNFNIVTTTGKEKNPASTSWSCREFATQMGLETANLSY